MKLRAITKKEWEQTIENGTASFLFQCAMDELDSQGEYFAAERLRSCQAMVYETTNFYILKSYETFVGVIDKRTNNCADVLREVYGYTSTSAQHIAKFISDFGSRYAKRFTWREI